MVALKNISTRNNIVICDYFPEGSDCLGHIEVDTGTGEIIRVDYSDYEYGKKTYAGKARAKLMELYASGEALPSEAVAIWY